MTRLWLDTEFNDFRGDLISMALVSEHGESWYGAVPCANPSPWVSQHVIPVLGSVLLFADTPQLGASLSLFLWGQHTRYQRPIEVVADWPEDLVHFFRVFITGPGAMHSVPPGLTTLLVTDLPGTAETSTCPHNALADAYALARNHVEAITKHLRRSKWLEMDRRAPL